MHHRHSDNWLQRRVRQTGAIFGLFLCCLSVSWAQTTAFTYQGKLTDAGNPANGNFDLQFKLFDTVTVGTGAQQGATLVRNPVAVSAGVFTVTLDFGANVFGGADRFLEIGVRPAGSANAYTVLAPRQPLTASPYAIQTLNAQQLGGLPASSYLQNTNTPQAGANLNIGGSGTMGSLNVNGPVSLGGVAAPAIAPTGQGRLYFDSTTNKLKVSESGGVFVNLVGATGVSGSGTVNSIPLWSAGTTLGSSLITQASNTINLPNSVIFGASTSGHVAQFGSPNTETGLTFSGAGGRADIRYSGTLKLVNSASGVPPDTNGIAITTAGNVGIGTTTPLNKLDVNGGIRSFLGASTQVVAETTGGTNSWARFYMITPSQRWFIGTSQNFNGNQFQLFDETNGQFRITVQPGDGALSFPIGNVGVGTATPAHRLSIGDGPLWTSAGWKGALELTNVSALGWQANAAGNRFGLGQSTGGLYFFRTASDPGTTGSPANYDLQITDNGHLTQPRDKSGLVKAMVFIGADGTILRCYNGITGTTAGNCGFSVSADGSGNYAVGFGFNVNDRFATVTAGRSGGTAAVASMTYGTSVINVSTFVVQDGGVAPAVFTIIVY